MEIRPQSGRQEAFLSSLADIVIYGGSAGGGKTWGLLLDPLRHINVPGFSATIFRRTYPEITKQGALWDSSESLYAYAGGIPVKGSLLWRWANGNRIEFNSIQYDDDLVKYLGAQICYIGFDQLETFTQKMFFYMIGRNRSICGVRPYIRATCNPDPDSFLVKFLSWWIAEDGYADLSRAGIIRWFVHDDNDNVIWADSPDELKEAYPEKFPLSCTFIPATVYDNKILMEKDPGYIAKLQSLPYIERMRLLGDSVRGGNWKVKAEAGKVFNRAWFGIVPSVPYGIEGRGWDFAAAEKSLKSKDPDYTASVKMRRVNGVYYIMDVTNERIAAGEVDSYLEMITRSDKGGAPSKYVARWEVEPGSAGLRESNRLARNLAGIDVKGIQSTGNKLSRWQALAAQVNAGNVKLLQAPWNDMFLTAMHGVPDLVHDDIPDAASLIFNELVNIPDPKPDENKQTPSAWVRAKGL